VRERINHALADAAAIKIVSNSDRSELVAGESFSVRAEVVHLHTRHFLQASLRCRRMSITKQEEKDVQQFTVGSRRAQTPRPATGCILSRRDGQRMHDVEVEGYAFDFSAPVTSLHATTVSVLSYRCDWFPPSPSPSSRTVLSWRRQPNKFEVFARVRSFAQTPSKVTVGVSVPSAGGATAGDVEFPGAGDRLAHMVVTPPAKIVAGITN